MTQMPLVAAIALIVTAVLFVVGIITLIVGFATHRVSMESPLADDDDNDDLSDDTATLLSMLPGASVVVDEHDEVVRCNPAATAWVWCQMTPLPSSMCWMPFTRRASPVASASST